MFPITDSGLARRGIGLVVLASVAFSVLLSPGAAAAPYEPNDAIPSAAGPLAIGQTYVANLETASDKDFFFFYVDSPSATQVELTVTNSGGDNASDLDVTILDLSATSIAAQAFIRNGETRTVVATLKPQKYFVEVATGQGFGETYTLTGVGGKGAFGSYTQIAARCENAATKVDAAQIGLDRAKAKLQRVIARLHRTRYGTPTARRSAGAAYRKARARLRAKRRALKTATGLSEPWCSIPQ